MPFQSKETADVAYAQMLCVASELNKLDPKANATAKIREGEDWGRIVYRVSLEAWGEYNYHVYFEMERTHLSAWRSKENGKLRLTLDSAYGIKAKSLPQRKDHSFDYAKAAQHVVDIRAAQVERATRESLAHRNDKLAESLRQKVGYGLGIDLSPSQYEEGKIIVTVKKSMTLEQAEKLAAFLKVL